MAELKINQQLINAETAEQLIKICPFSAITYENGKLAINSACKMCKMCVRSLGMIMELHAVYLL